MADETTTNPTPAAPAAEKPAPSKALVKAPAPDLAHLDEHRALRPYLLRTCARLAGADDKPANPHANHAAHAFVERFDRAINMVVMRFGLSGEDSRHAYELAFRAFLEDPNP